MNKENFEERLSLIKEKIDYLIIMNIEFKNYKNIVDGGQINGILRNIIRRMQLFTDRP